MVKKPWYHAVITLIVAVLFGSFIMSSALLLRWQPLTSRFDSSDTATVQRQKGSLGLVFPPHDLTHFAIETELGYTGGFYGLVADG